VIEQPRRHELLDARHTHGRGDRSVLAGASLRATDESYDQLAAEAVAENEGMPARGSLAFPWEGGGFGTHSEASLALLLETCDRSLERLRAAPNWRDRRLHDDLEIVRDRYAKELAALRDG
jgi:hypothetical protein